MGETPTDLSKVNPPQPAKPVSQPQSSGFDDLDIPVVESTSAFDATKYEGKKVKIVDLQPKFVKDLYPNGVYDPNSQETKKVVEVVTENLKELDENGNFTDKELTYKDKEGNVKPVTVTHRFNLQPMVDEKTGQVNWVISKHPKASLWAFMKKMGVLKVADLKGKSVMLNTKLSTREGEENKKYLIMVV